jgi:hypothetical protein
LSIEPKTPAAAAPAGPPADLEKEVIEEKRLVTARISETTRYIGFGLLAIFYAIISSHDPFPAHLNTGYPSALRVMALCGVVAVLFDYLQYLFGRRAVQRALDRKDKPFTYNRAWPSYRARQACFWIKQGGALLGAVIFLSVLVANL